MANELSEWPAWLGHPLKSELLGPGDFRLPKLQSDPAEPRWLVEHDTPKGRTLRGWNERLDRSSRDPIRYGSRDSLRSSFAVHLLEGQYREISQMIERRERRREQNISQNNPELGCSDLRTRFLSLIWTTHQSDRGDYINLCGVAQVTA